jgi:hypothetical protein
MFIGKECPKKTRAPEERNVVSEFASSIFRSSGAEKILWSHLTINIPSLRD